MREFNEAPHWDWPHLRGDKILKTLRGEYSATLEKEKPQKDSRLSEQKDK